MYHCTTIYIYSTYKRKKMYVVKIEKVRDQVFCWHTGTLFGFKNMNLTKKRVWYNFVYNIQTVRTYQTATVSPPGTHGTHKLLQVSSFIA